MMNTLNLFLGYFLVTGLELIFTKQLVEEVPMKWIGKPSATEMDKRPSATEMDNI